MTNEQKVHFLLKIGDFEGFRSSAYYCPSNCLTIGFGHRIRDNERKRLSLAKLTFKQAFDLLKQDFEKCLASFHDCNIMLEENELYALADIVYNCGWTNYAKGSLPKLALLYSDALNNYDYKRADELKQQICKKMLEYCHYKRNGIVYTSSGLLSRRKFDVSIFNGTNPILK